MTLQPLPIHVPTFPGETVDSFAHRAAAANHSTVTDIHAALRQHRLLTSRARNGPQRAHLWRQLGALPPHAFTTPTNPLGDPIPARPMCPTCAGGDTVIAHQPQLGMICLRHQCTLPPPHAPVGHLPGTLAAERRFRHLHRTRGLVLDSPAMTTARDTALLASTNDGAGRHLDAPLGPSAIAIFPSQVALAAVITDPSFLTITCRTTTPAPHRKNYIATRVARATGSDRTHISKAARHLWTVIDDLTDYLAAVHTGHRTFTDTAHHLLPYFSDPPNTTEAWKG
jgi:hypothetical protein